MSTPDPGEAPRARVVRGTPDELELAALVASLAAMAGGRPEAGDAPEAAARRRWRDGVERLRVRLAPGADAWRWSARP